MKNKLLTIAALAAGLVLGMACGGLGGSQVSCTVGTGTNLGCFEYSWGGVGVDVWTQACTAGGGTAGTACARAGAVGGCKVTVTEGTTTLSTTTWYYSGTAASLQSSCTSQGGSNGITATWVAP
jgi:hypothetical protein